ncbi:FAD-dependent thymidylate synthase [Candidatus Dependentiae bacterium]|nr:FAD-dependent thymidylate synthase [Candidatus Dependentiae bacterium]
MTKYPYGEQDPYSRVDLIASTQVHSDQYTVDQMPVLSARVSHAQSGKTGEDPKADKRLMDYLAEHLHMTPFEHQSVSFKVVLPLFVAREWMRHRTQAYNEVSMRYSSDPVGKFYYPAVWRKQAARNKQSSAGEVDDQAGCTKILQDAYEHALSAYHKLLEKGVCREQARSIIPVGNYTEFYATANLRNWFGFYKLRIAPDAQWEIRQYARCIDEILEELWPESWDSLKV